MVKAGRLTAKQKTFIGHYARTGDGPYSAVKAGYGAPHVDGYRLLDNPIIVDQARKIAQQRALRVVDKGLQRFDEIVDDRKSAPKDVVAVVKTAIPLAFPDGVGGLDDKDASEQSIPDIIANIRRYQAELDERDRRLKIIDNEPTTDGLFE